jgi:integrase
MNDTITIHYANLDFRLQSISEWKIPEETCSEVRLFIHELGIGKVNRGKRLRDNALLTYLCTLRVPLEYFNKRTQDLSAGDIEHFEHDLVSNSIQSTWRQRPYHHSTQVGFRKALNIFLRWRLGEAKARELAGWLDTRHRETTPAYLSEQEVARIYSHCRTPEQKYAIAVLFDSGARAEDFINIRLEDLQMPSGENTFARIVLKQEYSKTLGRTVSLYWQESLEALKDYLDERLIEGIKPQAPIFKNTYGSLRMFLKRLGKRTLKKAVHPHLLRHSSATYYASTLNRQEVCYRYGWRFSSNMPDIYISRAGMMGKDLDNTFAQTEMSELRDQQATLEVESTIKTDRIVELEKKI